MRLTLPVLLVCIGTIIGCATTTYDIPTDLKPEEYFQRAQEAVVERSDYRTARAYYEAYLARFSDNLQLEVEAEYEIAFIYYKLGEYETAQEKLELLLGKYRSDTAGLLPGWPLILASKVLANIEQLLTGEE